MVLLKDGLVQHRDLVVGEVRVLRWPWLAENIPPGASSDLSLLIMEALRGRFPDTRATRSVLVPTLDKG